MIKVQKSPRNFSFQAVLGKILQIPRENDSRVPLAHYHEAEETEAENLADSWRELKSL